MILLGIGTAAKQVYTSVPMLIESINSGYQKNSEELAASARLFQKTADENRKFMKQLYDAAQVDKERDQQMMIELIRRANIESEVIVESIEAAKEIVPPFQLEE